MGYETIGRGDGLGFGLNFLMILLGSMYEVKASIYTLGGIKKEGMYVGYNESSGGGIDTNGKDENGKYGMRFPIMPMELLLLAIFEKCS